MSKKYSAGSPRRELRQQEPTAPTEPSPQENEEPKPPCLQTLDRYARKAEAWALHLPTDPMYQTPCRECRKIMWTWSEKEDMCEHCGYELRIRREELRRDRGREQQRRAPAHNPFERQPDVVRPQTGVGDRAERQVNPFNRNAAHGKPHAVGITPGRRFFNPFK